MTVPYRKDTGAALGAQAGEAGLREIITSAGFATLRRVAETPFNIVLEARARPGRAGPARSTRRFGS